MRPFIAMSVMMALASPSVVHAQQQTMGGGVVPSPEPTTPTLRSGAAAAARGDLLQSAPPGLSQKPPRSEKAIGPDLMAIVFAPIGVVVAPINDGVHAFDAAIAPINAAFQPLTGPVNPVSVQPAVAEPPMVGPRK